MGSEIVVGLLTLTLLELVLGIDNIIFIAILASKLPADQQKKARNLGLTGALVTRIIFLLAISWIMGLERSLFTVMDNEFSGRDIILIVGGLFLIAKAVFEIHGKLEGGHGEHTAKSVKTTLRAVVIQIMLIDIVFSIDSVITAVGMVDQIWVMIVANVIALGFMLAGAGAIAAFVDKHPTIKILALSFLVMIGGNLLIEGFGYHIPKGYTYFAMAFAIGVEMINLKMRSAANKPVKLHGPEGA